MPAPDLLTSAERASKIHHLTGEATSLDTVSDSDLLVIDRRAADGTWANKKITAANLKSAVAPSAAAVPSEDSIQDGQVMEIFDDYTVGAISAFNKGTGWLNDGVGSGCSIVSRTHVDGRTQKRLEISAGQYGRKLPWADKWHRLKIILLWRLNHTATINPVDGYVGVCSGTTNMVASATTDNFIGVRWGDGASALTFTAGTKINYFDMGVSFRFHSRRGTTSTLIGAGGSGHSISADEGYLSGIIFEVGRPPFATDASSVLYSVKELSPAPGQVEFSRSKDLIRGLLSSHSTSLSSQSELEQAAVGQLGSNSVSFNQSTGALDTVNFSWPHVPGLEIAGLGVRKVY